MTDDTTLSAFGADDGGADSEVESGDDGDRTEQHETETDTATNDSGFSTYAYGEYVCGSCDAAVGRVWREDGVLVCPGCKTW
jgi:hypothetical protein